MERGKAMRQRFVQVLRSDEGREDPLDLVQRRFWARAKPLPAHRVYAFEARASGFRLQASVREEERSSSG
jgi:hypothetical protein